VYNILIQAMIKDNLSRIRGRISKVCSLINKDPQEITIVAVSKGRTVEQIKEVIEAGITDIGENKVQEALLKYRQLSATSYELRALRWHMVGHLQTNKVKEAVKIFNLIHSVDSLHLALEIDKQAAKINKVQDILIEVNTSDEATKFGIKPEGLIGLVKLVSELKNIRLLGLMTIAPIVDNQEKARAYFIRLRGLLEEVNTLGNTHNAIRILSMGMTDDFEVAIEEGATMLRLGRAIFE
jgi:pyridoxal phosphate enzyme (YggS family)